MSRNLTLIDLLDGDSETVYTYECNAVCYDFNFIDLFWEGEWKLSLKVCPLGHKIIMNCKDFFKEGYLLKKCNLVEMTLEEIVMIPVGTVFKTDKETYTYNSISNRNGGLSIKLLVQGYGFYMPLNQAKKSLVDRYGIPFGSKLV